MKEQRTNILSADILKTADAVCFTSNGIVKSNGELVMGAGVAKAFADKWPSITTAFGTLVKSVGNRVHVVHNVPTIISFPTKHHWKNPSDLALIKKSAQELIDVVNLNNWTKVYLPRPGVGLGGLDWKIVKAAIEPILDDRFTVCWL